MAQRIYVVEEDDRGVGVIYLVRAANPAQAIRHIVRGRFTASVAGQQALVDLTARGVKVEDAQEQEA